MIRIRLYPSDKRNDIIHLYGDESAKEHMIRSKFGQSYRCENDGRITNITELEVINVRESSPVTIESNEKHRTTTIYSYVYNVPPSVEICVNSSSIKPLCAYEPNIVGTDTRLSKENFLFQHQRNEKSHHLLVGTYTCYLNKLFETAVTKLHEQQSIGSNNESSATPKSPQDRKKMIIRKMFRRTPNTKSNEDDNAIEGTTTKTTMDDVDEKDSIMTRILDAVIRKNDHRKQLVDETFYAETIDIDNNRYNVYEKFTDLEPITVHGNTIISFRKIVQRIPVRLTFLGREYGLNRSNRTNTFVKVNMLQNFNDANTWDQIRAIASSRDHCYDSTNLTRQIVTSKRSFPLFRLYLERYTTNLDNFYQKVEQAKYPFAHNLSSEQISNQHQIIVCEPTEHEFLMEQIERRIFNRTDNKQPKKRGKVQIRAATLPWDVYRSFIIRPSRIENDGKVSNERLVTCYAIQNFLDLVGDLFALTNDRKFDRCYELATQLMTTRTKTSTKGNNETLQLSYRLNSMFDSFAKRHLDEYFVRLLSSASTTSSSSSPSSSLSSKTTINRYMEILETIECRLNVKNKSSKKSSLLIRLTEISIHILQNLSNCRKLSREQTLTYCMLWAKIDRNGELSTTRHVQNFVYAQEKQSPRRDVALVSFHCNNKNTNDDYILMIPYDQTKRRFVNSIKIDLGTMNEHRAIERNKLQPILINDFVENYRQPQNINDSTTGATITTAARDDLCYRYENTVNDNRNLTNARIANGVTAELITENTLNSIEGNRATVGSIVAIRLRKTSSKNNIDFTNSWLRSMETSVTRSIRIGLSRNVANEARYFLTLYSKPTSKQNTNYQNSTTKCRNDNENDDNCNDELTNGFDHLTYELYREHVKRSKEINDTIDRKLEIKFDFKDPMKPPPIYETLEKNVTTIERETTEENMEPIKRVSKNNARNQEETRKNENREIKVEQSNNTNEREEIKETNGMADVKENIGKTTETNITLTSTATNNKTGFLNDLMTTLTIVNKLLDLERYYVNSGNNDFFRLSGNLVNKMKLLRMYVEQLERNKNYDISDNDNSMEMKKRNNREKRRITIDMNNTIESVLDDIMRISECLLLSDRYETYRQLCVLMKSVAENGK